MAIGAQQLAGEISDDQAQKGYGPDHGRGHRDAEGNAQQQTADAAVVVHAQIDSLLLAQCEHVQQGQLAAQRKGHPRQQEGGKKQNFGIDVAEAGHQAAQQRVVFIGIHHPGEGGLDAAEKGGEHGAHQQHIQHIVLCFAKDPAIQQGGGDAHEDHIHAKSQICIGGHDTGRPQKEYNRGMNQGIQGIHAQQAGGHDGVVDNGLEHDGRSADGHRSERHGRQLRGTDLHGIGKQSGVARVGIHHQIARGAQKRQHYQQHQSAPVGANSS